MQLAFGFYKRSFVFFSLLFVVLGGIFYFTNRQSSSASINEASVTTSSGIYNIDITISKDAKVLVNDKYYNSLLSPGKDSDEFRYIAAEREGIYVDKLNIYVHLPEPVTQATAKQLVYAIHGVGSHSYYMQDSKTLVYTANNISPAATFTVVAELPKNLVKFPWWRDILTYLYNTPAWAWIGVSVVLPLFALVILIFMFRQAISDWRQKKSKDLLATPPSNLTPTEVGVLVEGNISARLIAATLLDLATRNYVLVINKGKEFSFGKKKTVDLDNTNTGLKPFEKILLSKIFSEQGLTSSTRDIQVRIGRHVFSRKIAEVYLSIYEGITQKGFFLENPSVMHKRYKSLGLKLFFIGLVGFIFGIFFAPDPKFYLLFWAAMIFTSFIIIRLSPQLPSRTEKGKVELQKWLKFKKYLSDPMPLGYSVGGQELFEKYLPYAIALRCESEWVKRFIEHPFRLPDWYISTQPTVILEDFVGGLLPIIGFISNELAASREPIV